MYIPPFWAGVIATLFVELLTVFVAAMFSKEGEDSKNG